MVLYVYKSNGVKTALTTHGLGNIYLFQNGGPYII